MDSNKDTVLARFIYKKINLDENNNPKPNVFIRRPNEKGLSVWDITKYIRINNEAAIFNLGDKKVAKNPPHTLARCDLNASDINTIFEDTRKEYQNINFKITKGTNPFSVHRELEFSIFDDPATEYAIARKLLNISKFKKHPTRL